MPSGIDTPLHACGVDDDTGASILFQEWVTSIERYWVTSGEQRRMPCDGGLFGNNHACPKPGVVLRIKTPVHRVIDLEVAGELLRTWRRPRCKGSGREQVTPRFVVRCARRRVDTLFLYLGAHACSLGLELKAVAQSRMITVALRGRSPAREARQGLIPLRYSTWGHGGDFCRPMSPPLRPRVLLQLQARWGLWGHWWHFPATH